MSDLNVVAAAESLGVSPKTVYRMLRAGKLQGYRVGAGRGDWRVRQHAIELAKRPVDVAATSHSRARANAKRHGRLPGWNKFA